MPARPAMPSSSISGSERPCIMLAPAWYAPAIHRGIARYAQQADWILDTRMTRDGRVPPSWQGDGIICLLSEDPLLREFVRQSTKPVVNIGDIDLPGIPSVRCDDAAIGRLAADHFIHRGFRHAAFYRASTTPSANRRQRAFQRRVEQSGGAFHRIDWPAAQQRDTIPESQRLDWLGRQLLALPRPLAVFSEHDEVSIEVLHACRRQRIPVPEQIAVLGVDDDPLRCEFAPVPLSSIDNNQEAEGYRAAELLDRLLHGQRVKTARVHVPPVGISTRLSTDILAVKHPQVAAALHHIWQNYTRPINAKTVAATVPLSYRHLYQLFREEIGRTIAEEITLRRLEKAQKLLVETSLRAREVAEASGFPGEDRMGRVFRRLLDQTPLEYRQRNGTRQ